MLLGLLLLTLLMASLAGPGREGYDLKNRVHWWAVGLCLLIASQIANPYAAVLMALCALGLTNAYQPSRLLQYVWAMATVGGVYAALSPAMRPWMVEPVLWMLVAITSCLGLWGLYSMRRLRLCSKYERIWPIWGPFKIRLYEPVRDIGIECGQGHPNHLQCVQVLGIAAVIGLGVLGYWWLWLLIPLLYVPIQASQRFAAWNQPTQGVFHLLNLAVGGAALQLGAGLGVALVGSYAVGLVILARPWNLRTHEWADNGRLEVWVRMLKRWVSQPWLCWIFGIGTGSWVITHVEQLTTEHEQERRNNLILFTAAHNEYLQQLVEYGVVGLAALLLYVGTALEFLAHAGPVGMALFYPALACCSFALVNFPWTFYHEVAFGQQNQLNCHGAPALNAGSLTVALLYEGVHNG